MAAGDVSIDGDSGRAIRGKVMVWGTVTLDGANPTPIDLAAHMRTVERCVVTNRRSTAPGLDPVEFTVAYDGAKVNLYAWKHTASGDATLVASTDNDDTVDFMAIGAR